MWLFCMLFFFLYWASGILQRPIAKHVTDESCCEWLLGGQQKEEGFMWLNLSLVILDPTQIPKSLRDEGVQVSSQWYYSQLRFIPFYLISLWVSGQAIIIYSQESVRRTSLVVQWLRTHLPMQGTWVQSLLGELNPSCLVQLSLHAHNYWVQMLWGPCNERFCMLKLTADAVK